MSDQDPIVLGSGFEGRIVAEYLKRRKRLRAAGLDEVEVADAINDIWLDMASKHKRSVRELKNILNLWQTEQNPNRTFEPPNRLRGRPRVCACGETKDVKWTEDPYNADVLGDYSKRWMCPSCIHEHAMDV